MAEITAESIKKDHPDWTDDQVAAELEKAKGQDPAAEGLKRALQEERDKRQALETTVTQLQKAQEDAQNANLSDIEKATKAAEKAQKERDEAISKLQETTRKTTILSVASRLEMNDPNDAIAHLGLTSDEWEDPQKVEKTLSDLKETKSYLFKSTTGPGNVGGPANHGGAPGSAPQNEDEATLSFWQRFAAGPPTR